MPRLYDIAMMNTSTVGTGTITLTTAVSPWLTFALSGVQNADVVYYGIKDGSNSEVGFGTYTSAGTTLTRNPYKSTNANAAISLSGSATVYIATLSSDGGDHLPGTNTPMRGFDTAINLQLTASVASNLLTIAVKSNVGVDATTTNPVLIPFRDPTIANGGPVWRTVTAALSITTNAVGATLGTVNTVPFRLWVVAFDNAGTVVLGLWQSVTGGASPTAIAPLNEAAVVSSTAMSAAATSAGTFYSPNGTTITSKSFRILGYVDYAAGLTTAGTYASVPTTVQLFGPGIRKPGEIVQVAFGSTSTATTTTSATYGTGAPPTNAPTATISLSTTPNVVLASYFGSLKVGAGTTIGALQLFRGASGAVNTAIGPQVGINGTAVLDIPASTSVIDAPGTVTAQIYTIRIKSSDGASTVTSNTTDFGTPTGNITVKEIMV